jgi:peroxiredoxin
MVLEVIIENNESVTPSQDDLVEWADKFGLTMPVLADDGASVMWRYSSGGLPTIVLIDRGMVLSSVDEFAQEPEIEALLSKYE